MSDKEKQITSQTQSVLNENLSSFPLSNNTTNSTLSPYITFYGQNLSQIPTSSMQANINYPSHYLNPQIIQANYVQTENLQGITMIDAQTNQLNLKIRFCRIAFRTYKKLFFEKERKAYRRMIIFHYTANIGYLVLIGMYIRKYNVPPSMQSILLVSYIMTSVNFLFLNERFKIMFKAFDSLFYGMTLPEIQRNIEEYEASIIKV